MRFRDVQAKRRVHAKSRRATSRTTSSARFPSAVRVHPLPEGEKWVDTVFIRHREAYASSSLQAFLDIARPALISALAAE